MALDVDKLKDALASLFRGEPDFPATKEAAGQRWAEIYAEYAKDAVSCQTQGPIDGVIDAAVPLLAQSLAVAFTGFGSVSCANGMAAAFTTFWSLPPIAFKGTTPGAVIAVGGAAILAATLIANWVSNVASKISAEDAAVQHAAVFDAFTRTVVVGHAPPSACTSVVA